MKDQMAVSGQSARTQRRPSTAPRVVAGSWRRLRRPVRVDVQVEEDRGAEANDGAHAGDQLTFASTCPRCLDTVFSLYGARPRCSFCLR
jgi:hypothetical protein